MSRVPILMGVVCLQAMACGLVENSYEIARETVSATYQVSRLGGRLAVGTGKAVFKVGEFTFKVAMAPLSWPLTREELQSIDGLEPKDAIRTGRVKRSPYVVNGRRYVPYSLAEAREYREAGIASWYGYETYDRRGGRMTANGEAFDPEGLSAAHKYLPLPSYVRVTNLENWRSLIVRVNDRGPFIRGRIIDLSAGAAKRLGYHRKGTTRVLVEAVAVED